MDFSSFDRRKYPTVPVQAGYGEWAATYEQSVVDEMDIRLLARMTAVPWERCAPVLDLACGTGRTGAWLRSKGVPVIDGVDLTREMLSAARGRGLYRNLLIGYHPHFLLNGLITHFHRADGEAVAIESYVHLLSDHVKAAHRAGWTLLEMDESIVDAAWIAEKPQWAQYRNRPVSFGMVWRKTSA